MPFLIRQSFGVMDGKEKRNIFHPAAFIEQFGEIRKLNIGGLLQWQ
jgi:hypothetical protein